MKNNNAHTDFLKTDFSLEGKKEKIKQTAIENAYSASQKENDMKFSYRKTVAAALVVFCAVGFSATSYGKSFYNIIKEAIVGNHASYVVYEDNFDGDYTVPDELQGFVFDEEGNALTEFPKEGMIYNENGKQVSTIINESGSLEIVTEEEIRLKQNHLYTYADTLEEAAGYLSFKPMVPQYLPEGYRIEKYMLFNDSDGKPERMSEYLQFYITNENIEKDIYVQLRLMNEDTAYTAGIGDFEETEINGYPGIISSDGMNIDYEVDGVMIMVMAGKSGIASDEIMKIAESFK